MIEVHPPEHVLHSWRDFFVHLSTITIGLLIALSLEGCVEWRHHRHLVHEAEASLQGEIKTNAGDVAGALEDARREQATLAGDIGILKRIIANPKVENHEEFTVNFRIRTFEDVSWKTAQSTGALGYMPYEQAHEYSNLYSQQNEVYLAEKQAARDLVVALGPIVSLKKGEANPDAEDSERIKQNFEVLQAQMIYLQSEIEVLDAAYKKYLAAHPE
ncbi:MAG: hypothetical protein WDN23_15910 [Edaphobacter sp.]